MLRRLLISFSLLLGSEGIVRLLNFALHIFLARTLAREGIGQLGAANSFLIILGGFASVGMDGIFPREAAANRERMGQLLGNTILLRLASGALALLVVNGLILAIPGYQHLRLLVAAGSLMFLVQALRPVRHVFDIVLRHKRPATAQVLAGGLNVLGCVALVLLGGGVLGVVVWGVVVAAAEALLWVRWCRPFVRPVWRIDLRLWWELAREGWWLMIPGLFICLYTRIDQIFIYNWLGEAENGAYAAAVKLNEMFIVLPMVGTSLLFPIFSRLAREPGGERFRETARRVFRLTAFGAVVLVILLTLYAEPLVTAFYGEAFAAAAQPLMVLSWSLVWVFLGIVNHHLLVSLGRQKIDVAITGGNALLNILLNLALIPWLGLTGAALATALSYGSGAFMGLAFEGSRALSLELLRALAPMALAALAAGLLGKALLERGVAQGLVIVALFAVFQMLLGGVNRGDFKPLR